jgi:hypothetical protein
MSEKGIELQRGRTARNEEIKFKRFSTGKKCHKRKKMHTIETCLLITVRVGILIDMEKSVCFHFAEHSRMSNSKHLPRNVRDFFIKSRVHNLSWSLNFPTIACSVDDEFQLN